MEEVTLDGYREHLLMVFGFEAAVEHALQRTPGLDPRVLRARTKTGKLIQDLLAIGCPEQDLVRSSCFAMRPFQSTAEAFGWMYVVERNTLLFGLIRRHLAQQGGLRGALGYLGCYGDTPGAMFRDLGELLNAEAERSPDGVANVIAAAHRAFWSQRHWFLSHGRRAETPLAS